MGFHMSSDSSRSTIFLINRGSNRRLDFKIDILFLSLHFTVGTSNEERVEFNTFESVENFRDLLAVIDGRTRIRIQRIIKFMILNFIIGSQISSYSPLNFLLCLPLLFFVVRNSKTFETFFQRYRYLTIRYSKR